jgi:hypothetical protein
VEKLRMAEDILSVRWILSSGKRRNPRQFTARGVRERIPDAFDSRR